MMMFPEGTTRRVNPVCVRPRELNTFLDYPSKPPKCMSAFYATRSSLFIFLQANFRHHYSTPTYTHLALFACPFSTKRSLGNRQLQSNKSADVRAYMRIC